MIIGDDILQRGLIKDGDARHLKNSTYDLTVGEIVPIGKKAIIARRKQPKISPYYLEPREMVWVLSKEEFNVPGNVTGLATLRTTFTKQGILALNVGIIDPFFRGPISTALINFSDRPRRIEVGERFFRIAFFEHTDVTKFHSRDESIDRLDYVKHLEDVSYADFSSSFLNIPSFDDEFYAKKFWSIFWYGITKNKKISLLPALVLFLIAWYLFETGFWTFLVAKWDWVGEVFKKFWFW